VFWLRLIVTRSLLGADKEDTMTRPEPLRGVGGGE
jgi:hypothetical protein